MVESPSPPMGEEQQEEKKAEAQPEEKGEEKKEGKVDEKKEDGKKEAKKDEAIKPPEPVVLFVDMHCVGCAKKVERTILKVRGVEDVKINMVENQVTVKGMVDPQGLCARIQRKTKRRASVISPIVLPVISESENAKTEVVVNAQASEMSTVVLDINMHCEACALQLQKKILKMRGVQVAETDLASSKVTVTGTMDTSKLVEYIYRRTRKQARIVPPPKTEEEKPVEEPKAEEKADLEKKEEEKKEEDKKNIAEEGEQKEEEKKDESKGKPEQNVGGGEAGEGMPVSVEDDGIKKMVYYPPIYVMERVYAPQIFSDENPNACCIS